MTAASPCALILANGEPPSAALLQRCLAACEWFCCTDGAAVAAVALGCPPETVVGDLDSLPADLAGDWELVPVSEQETTDLEKACRLAVKRGYRQAVVLGAGGRRWDQWWGNLSVLARWSDRLDWSAGDDHGWLRLIPAGGWQPVVAPVGAKVSLLPLPRAVGVNLAGFRWPLVDATLALGDRDGISNEVIDESAQVRYLEGCLASYLVTAGG